MRWRDRKLRQMRYFTLRCSVALLTRATCIDFGLGVDSCRGARGSLLRRCNRAILPQNFASDDDELLDNVIRRQNEQASTSGRSSKQTVDPRFLGGVAPQSAPLLPGAVAAVEMDDYDEDDEDGDDGGLRGGIAPAPVAAVGPAVLGVVPLSSKVHAAPPPPGVGGPGDVALAVDLDAELDRVQPDAAAEEAREERPPGFEVR